MRGHRLDPALVDDAHDLGDLTVALVSRSRSPVKCTIVDAGSHR